jgi:hypothetical protein
MATKILTPCNIGFAPGSKIHIRARKTLNETEYDNTELAYLNIQGSANWLQNQNFINNGMERIFELNNPSSDIQDLNGQTYSFLSYSRSGVLFPKPLTSDFIKFKKDDVAGNESYTIKNVEDFYQRQTALDNSTVYYTGWREGSRISFEFVEMTPEMGPLPYESHKVIIPSGNCIIEGEFGYTGQADRSIFTEGVYLKDETEGDIIREQIYGPDFVSPVLKRVPFFSYPTGDFEHPILEAPSVFKQRIGNLVTPENEFSGLNTFSPHNYNKMLWNAKSDLAILNSEETLEQDFIDDGNTFLNSTILISAALGQKLSNGNFNPNTKKYYVVRSQFQMIDSISTDAIINKDVFLTSGYGFQTSLNQPESGYICPAGTTATMIKNALI